jgi:hypothetical protein
LGRRRGRWRRWLVARLRAWGRGGREGGCRVPFEVETDVATRRRMPMQHHHTTSKHLAVRAGAPRSRTAPRPVEPLLLPGGHPRALARTAASGVAAAWAAPAPPFPQEHSIGLVAAGFRRHKATVQARQQQLVQQARTSGSLAATRPSRFITRGNRGVKDSIASAIADIRAAAAARCSAAALHCGVNERASARRELFLERYASKHRYARASWQRSSAELSDTHPAARSPAERFYPCAAAAQREGPPPPSPKLLHPAPCLGSAVTMSLLHQHTKAHRADAANATSSRCSTDKPGGPRACCHGQGGKQNLLARKAACLSGCPPSKHASAPAGQSPDATLSRTPHTRRPVRPPARPSSGRPQGRRPARQRPRCAI